MLLDNLFHALGGPGTALMMLGILAFVGVAPVGALLLPEEALRRALRSSRAR